MMRMLLFLILAIGLISPMVNADQTQEKPFAVVELFSSEGCSSCPSADLLLSKLTAWARQNNEPVYPLVFHVDYWNHLGWRDVFSRVEFTQRQTSYAHIFKDQGMYTPQMVVNGSDAFVGSDQKQLQNDLDRQLVLPANGSLEISLAKQDQVLTVNYRAEGFPKGDLVNIALVERGLSTEVTAGENAGRTLHHDNLVREFQSNLLISASSQASISLAKVVDTTQASVIVYVQNPQTMLIEDAKQVDVEHD